MIAAVVLTLTAGWLTLISGLVIPLITGLITRLDASTGTKSIVTILLAALSGVLVAVVNDVGVLTTETLINALVALGLALGAFYGIYSPFNTDAKLAPKFGFGKV